MIIDFVTTLFWLLCDSDETWRIFSVSPQSRSLFSASFQTFCLTARPYLNTQKYGLFCSLWQVLKIAFGSLQIWKFSGVQSNKVRALGTRDTVRYTDRKKERKKERRNCPITPYPPPSATKRKWSVPKRKLFKDIQKSLSFWCSESTTFTTYFLGPRS